MSLVKSMKNYFSQGFTPILILISLFTTIKQFGFRSNYSTNHAILSITEHIKAFVDTSHYVCGIFVDLEKAFDTVNHKILLWTTW